MFILDTLNRDCGWLPDQTIQLIANIYTIIKFLVPILIIIMGSIDFLKAVMAQQDDQMKKAQSAFLQKVIAGALVFFVAVIVGWIIKLIADLDTSGETTAGNTFTCLNLILNGGYSKNDKDYFTPDDNSSTDDNSNDNNNSNNDTNENNSDCGQVNDYIKTDDCKNIHNANAQHFCAQNLYNKCIIAKYNKQQNEFNNCLASANCTLSTIDSDNCKTCLNTSEVEKYIYLKNKAKEFCKYPYMDNIDTFLPACMNDFDKKPKDIFEAFDNIGPDLYNRCLSSLTESGKEKCCHNLYEKFNEKQNECIDTSISKSKTDIVKWYCNKYPDKC